MGRSSSSSVVQCTVWLHSPVCEFAKGEWSDASGSGHAGGGGYCKQSAACEDAMRNAGIKCDQGISGRGMSTVDEFLEALAKMAAFKHA